VRTTRRLVLLFTLLGLLATACNPTATPAAQPAQPTATAASSESKESVATATPALTETPVPPTATPVPPTPTPVPPTNTPGPPTTAPTATPEPAADTGLLGSCFNPYYPIKEGVTWRYRSLSSASEPTEYSVTYSDVSADGFTTHQIYPDLETETRWTCSESGLVSAQFARIVLDQVPGFELESIEFNGVTLPPAEQWKVGLKWNSEYQITGKMTLEGIGPIAANYDIATANEIVAIDAISVPAGDYPEALRVDSSTHMVITGKADDVSIPTIEFEFQNTAWHVKDVGLVKSETANQMGTFTTELLAIE
jgi:hypothetical protein